MSNFIIYSVVGLGGVGFLLMIVLLFRAVILCENEKSSSSGLQIKNYSKASFLNALARM
ncbi:MAG: hypothetical protein PHR82_00530 [Endomicrobiaceae bacterium]|nr:hypothetical protein [Endomicrobiaceae bacterium]